jgi:hypothetical protein
MELLKFFKKKTVLKPSNEPNSKILNFLLKSILSFYLNIIIQEGMW